MDLATVHRLFWQSQCPTSTISVRSDETAHNGGERSRRLGRKCSPGRFFKFLGESNTGRVIGDSAM